MINPSANGWIDKFFTLQLPQNVPAKPSHEEMYLKIRETGFIYGHIIGFSTAVAINHNKWLSDEMSKLALLNTLYQMYTVVTDDADSKNFIRKAVAYYDEMHPKSFTLFKHVLPGNSISAQLENILDERVQTNDNFISKNFSHIVTNALLFIDVLGFRHYLIHSSSPEKYLKKTEEIIINVISHALKVKSNKSAHDKLLIKLFEASVRYSKFSKVTTNDSDDLQLDYFTSDFEKFYLIDIAAIALSGDNVIENREESYLTSIAKTMDVSENFVLQSIRDTNSFIENHRKQIAYLHYSNPVKHFYDHMTQSVVVLITRNKNRLIKEIRKSGELMVLLANSARRDLDPKEKKKVKKQLLEICKTIPSLTIFLLPGGSLLLPLLIKFIPQLLPSAFNENLHETE